VIDLVNFELRVKNESAMAKSKTNHIEWTIYDVSLQHYPQQNMDCDDESSTKQTLHGIESDLEVRSASGVPTVLHRTKPISPISTKSSATSSSGVPVISPSSVDHSPNPSPSLYRFSDREATTCCVNDSSTIPTEPIGNVSLNTKKRELAEKRSHLEECLHRLVGSNHITAKDEDHPPNQQEPEEKCGQVGTKITLELERSNSSPSRERNTYQNNQNAVVSDQESSCGSFEASALTDTQWSGNLSSENSAKIFSVKNMIFPAQNGKCSFTFTGPVIQVNYNEIAETLRHLSIPARAQGGETVALPHGDKCKIVYDNGQVYRGQVRFGLRHGFGENVWLEERQRYEGMWHKDHRHGKFGVQSWSKWPRKLCGSWKNGHVDGSYISLVANVEPGRDQICYEGHCQCGKQHGRATQLFCHGRKLYYYSGQFVEGSPDGYGTLVEPLNKSGPTCLNSLKGLADLSWKQGKQDKESFEAVSAQLKIFRGQFMEGMRHGYGVQYWFGRSKQQYDGEWYRNKFHGRGRLRWSKDIRRPLDIYGPDSETEASASTYTGNFRCGKFHGKGCLIDASGNKYVGEWEGGRKEGSGKHSLRDGSVYIGQFHRGRRHGYGRLTSVDGGLYSGSWSQGKRSGRGIQMAPDGSIVHCGIWEEDEPVGLQEILQSGSQKESSKAPHYRPTTGRRNFKRGKSMILVEV